MPQAFTLAIIAGYADTVGYLHFDAFAGLMTGNTILLGIELATKQFVRAGFHAVIIVAFLSGVIAARSVLRHGWHAAVPLTVTALLFIVCSFVAKSWGAVLLALAMGIQNSAANRFNGVALNTVFITGNLQKLGEELVAWLWPESGNAAARRSGAGIFALVWLAYALGAALGALANSSMARPLLPPAVLLPFVMGGLGRLRPGAAR